MFWAFLKKTEAAIRDRTPQAKISDRFGRIIPLISVKPSLFSVSRSKKTAFYGFLPGNAHETTSLRIFVKFSFIRFPEIVSL